MKMKMDLSDKYVTETEAMKRKHCLELEQLRDRLSEEHSKGRMVWHTGKENSKLLVWLIFFIKQVYLKKFSTY